MKAIVNSSMNYLLQSDEIIVGTVIQVTRHNVNKIKEENMMIIHEMIVLQKDCEDLAEGTLAMVPKPVPVQSSAAFGNSGFGNNSESTISEVLTIFLEDYHLVNNHHVLLLNFVHVVSGYLTNCPNYYLIALQEIIHATIHYGFHF